MQLTLTLYWWMIPLVVTIGCIIYVMIIGAKDKSGFLQGLSTIFAMVPALIIITISWIVGAIFK